MRRPSRIYTYAIGLLCVMLSLRMLGATAYAFPLDRYSDVTTPDTSSEAETDSDSHTAVHNYEATVGSTKEDLDVKKFNGVILDTVIYSLGILSGMMMFLQISAYVICRVFPSWNDKVAKLRKIGITGYEDSLLAFCLKVGLLGVFAVVCTTGMMKRFIGWIIGIFHIYFMGG